MNHFQIHIYLWVTTSNPKKYFATYRLGNTGVADAC